MKRVLITGSGGVIGKILTKGLPHDTTDFDLPHSDILNLDHLLTAAKGHEALIHLAWNKKHDDWLTENLDIQNMQGSFNVYEAAHLSRVKKVIIASSVHADDFTGKHKDHVLDPFALPTPDSPYGASKCMIEALGRYYASSKGLEVVCIRFGGVNAADKPPEHPFSERQVWLSQRDCISLVQACIAADPIPGKFTVLYGISNNYKLMHNLTNPFGWIPVDGATSV